MSETFEHSVSPIVREDVDAAFGQVAHTMKNLGGMEQIDALVALVGDPESYNALINGSEAFIKANPNIFKGGIASPEVRALWAGLIVGSAVRKF
jgi:hypothetical protein